MGFYRSSKKPALSSGAYTSGDVVGGVLDFDGPFGGAGTGVVKTVTVKDSANQKQPLVVLLFGARPTGTYTDDGGFTWGSGDFDKLIGYVSVPTAAYTDVNGKAFAHLETFAIPGDFTNNKVYAVVYTTGTPTYGAAGLEIVLGVVT